MTYREHMTFLERHVEAMQELTERRRAEAELAGFVLGGRVTSVEAVPPTVYQDESEQARFEMGFSDGRWMKNQQPQQS